MPLPHAPCRFDPVLPRLLNAAAVVFILAAGLHASAATAAGAAAKSVPAASSPSAEETGTSLRAQVQRLVGRAACDDDSQCRTLPLGARACGGPESYVAWSVLGTDQAALRRAGERYSQWQAQEQSRSGAMSICMIEIDPGAVCSRDTTAGARTPGRCVRGKGGAAGVSR